MPGAFYANSRLTGITPAEEPDPEATLWVNGSTGSDSNTIAQVRAGAGTVAWATIGRAAWGSTTRSSPNTAEAAVAGDVVSIADGTYSAGGFTPSNYLTDNVYWNPANNGSSGNPIRFQSAGGYGAVTLTNVGGIAALIGAREKDYIIWSGFNIHEDTAPSALSHVSQVLWYGSEGGGLEDTIMTGNAAGELETGVIGDNWSGVRIHSSTGQRIYNCTSVEFGVAFGDENHSGLTTYQGTDLTVEHCDMSRNGSGIYIKGNLSSPNTAIGYFTIRYNIFEDNLDGGIYCFAGATSTDANPCLIYQNLFKNNQFQGIKLAALGGQAWDPRYNHFVNNTFIGGEVAYGQYGTIDNTHVFWNNICAGQTSSAIYSHFPANLVDTDFEHNDYYNFPDFASLNGVGQITLATWKATYTRDTDSPAAISSDPQFVNAGTGDYHLQGGSPALTQGRVTRSIGGTNGDTIPAGMYITGSEVIGRVT